MVVQFLSKINKLKAMNKGQVSTEIATLVRGGGVLSTELYNIYIYIYIYIYVYIYIGSLSFDFSIVVSICRSRVRYIWTFEENYIDQFISWRILQDIPTTAQAKNATSASKKNFLSSADMNYHHSIKVMNSCCHAPQKRNVTS